MITSELRIKDIELLKSMQERHAKAKQSSATKSPAALKAWEAERDAQQKFLDWLEGGKDIRNGMDVWTTKEIEYLNDYQFLTSKPVMFAVNLSFQDFKRKKNKFLKPIFDWVQQNAKDSVIIPYCGAYEEEIQELTPEQMKEKE